MSPEADLLLRNASELVTCAGDGSGPRKGSSQGELGMVEGGTVAARDGKIVAVGPDPEVMASIALTDDARVLDASGRAVIPGFVDPHTHLVFSGTREFELDLKLRGKTYLEILAAGGGILHTVKGTRESDLATMVSDAMARLDTMALWGTTTVEGKSGYGLDTPTEIRSLEAIAEAGRLHPLDVVPTFLGAHAVPPEYKDRPDEYIDLVIDEMLPVVEEGKLARFCDVFCEEGVFTVEQSRRLLEAARSRGLIPKLHADEIVDLGGAALAAEVGAISADHLLMANHEGLRAMVDAGTIGVLLPGTPFALMMKDYPDARKMIDMGLPLALATDLNPNCCTESMPFMIQLACFCMKMTPAEALVAATINAAHAIGEHQRVGSLEVGKAADMVILNAPNHMHIPYHFGVNLIATVIKNGKVMVEDGVRVG